MSVVTEVLEDLRAENEELDALVARLDQAAWAIPTPAVGWTVAHQIGHLASTDTTAVRAITDPEGFLAEVAQVADLTAEVDRLAAEAAEATPGELLSRWRVGRAELAHILATTPAKEKLPWFGPPMSVPSMATARLMETWAHSMDVYDALGLPKPASARVRHIARLGVRTRDFSYHVHGEQPPVEDFRVELTGPDGEVWEFGPSEASQRVTGPAHDFALLVTRRRHPSDLAVRAEGVDAEHWLTIAQAFAGAPGADPQPR